MANRKEDNALARKNIAQMELLRKKLEETDTYVLREMLGYLIEQIMNTDVDAICGAEYGERSHKALLPMNLVGILLWLLQIYIDIN